jgi:LacI family transcriptional regulator
MTISEIAKLANVSIGTVDRVLHKRGRVAPQTAEKVMAIVRDYGYRPNPYARTLKLSKTFRIGILLPRLHSEYGYWNLVYEGVLKAAKELSPLSVSVDLVEFDRRDPSDFLRAGERLFGLCPDAVLFPPVLPEASRSLIEEHPHTDFAFVDSPLPEAGAITAVVQDPFRGGYLAGRMMDLLSPRKGTYLTVQTHASAFNSTERARGFRAYFADKEGYEIADLRPDLEQEGKTIIEKAYRDREGIEGMFVVNDAVHQVARIVSDLGRKNQTVLIGYDLIEQNRKAMQEHLVDCLLSQRPQFQGYSGIYQLYRKNMLGQIPERKIELPIDIILPENLQDGQSNFVFGENLR